MTDRGAPNTFMGIRQDEKITYRIIFIYNANAANYYLTE